MRVWRAAASGQYPAFSGRDGGDRDGTCDEDQMQDDEDE